MKRRSSILILLLLWSGISIIVSAQSELDFPATNAVWTRDRNIIITSHGSKLAFWNAEGDLLEIFPIVDTVSGDRLSIGSLALSPDNHYLAIGGTPFDPIGLVFVMDLETKQFVAELENENHVQDIDWSHDGSFIAVSSPNTQGFAGEDSIIFWDTESYTEISRIEGEATEGISGVALSPNDTQVAVITSLLSDVQVWDIRNGNRLRNLSSHAETLDSIAWSTDGKYIAVSTSALLDPIYSIELWETETWTNTATINVEASFSHIEENPIYPIFAALNSEEIIIFDSQGQIQSSVPLGASFTWSPEGTRIATGDIMDYTKLRIYDVCTNEEASKELMACPEPID